MYSTIKKYLQFFHTIFKTTQKATSPMYNLIAGLSILILSLLLESLNMKGIGIFLFMGVMITFIMSFKASFYYYRKSKKLENKLNQLNR